MLKKQFFVKTNLSQIWRQEKCCRIFENLSHHHFSQTLSHYLSTNKPLEISEETKSPKKDWTRFSQMIRSLRRQQICTGKLTGIV